MTYTTRQSERYCNETTLANARRTLRNMPVHGRRAMFVLVTAAASIGAFAGIALATLI